MPNKSHQYHVVEKDLQLLTYTTIYTTDDLLQAEIMLEHLRRVAHNRYTFHIESKSQ